MGTGGALRHRFARFFERLDPAAVASRTHRQSMPGADAGADRLVIGVIPPGDGLRVLDAGVRRG